MTSNASSYRKNTLARSATWQTTAATRPMMIADVVVTYPAQGVTVASPATAPVTPPRTVGWPSCRCSSSSQTSMAAAAAMWVLTRAWAATPSALSPSPALNPNQPNQRIPAPMITSGIECGSGAWSGQARRLPRTISRASAAAPAEACTTIPPAQSCAPCCVNHPAGAQSQWAIGAYTMTDQTARNTTHPANFIRSATAPVASAGVMTANIIW